MSRVAFLFRYGVEAHAELYPAVPHILRELGKKNQVVYIGPNGGGIDDSLTFEGVRYVCVPFKVDRSSFRDKLLKTLLWYLYLPCFAVYLRFWKPDIIWIDESIPYAGVLTALLSGRPVVLTVVDFFMEIYAEKSRLLRPFAVLTLWFDRIGWKMACGIFTRAESTRKHLISQGIASEKIVTVRDAVQSDVFFPVNARATREALGFQEEDIVICHHGILHPNKGIDRVIRWISEATACNDKYKLLVVGGGPEEAALRRLVSDIGLDGSVKFTGWLPSHADVNMHLNAADIGLVMRIGQFSDNFHVTGALVHCMMCELPVLAARLKGVEEVIFEGDNGVLFSPSNKNEFLDKLEFLASATDRRAQIGKAARSTALRLFDANAVAKDTISALDSFLGRSA